MSDDPLLGAVLAGCRVERLLGRGGMGAVYLGRRASDGLGVVLKVLPPELCGDPSLRARFEREGQALRKIRPHPHVVRVHAVHAQAETPCIVMEYVEGIGLLQLLQRHGPFPPEQVARVGRDAALGLAAVHAHGLLHRDVKPDNLLRMGSGLTKIVDFGIAKDVFMSGLTAPGQLLGTSYYMSPEQWEGTVHDARSDVFGLGATLYHLLVGQPPFVGEDLAEVMDLCLSGDFEPPSELRPDVPPALEAILLQTLMPEPVFRYARMKDLAEDFARVLRGEAPRVTALVDDGGARTPLLLRRRYTVGRKPDCQLTLTDRTVSGYHAELRREDEGWSLRDLKSSYGTKLDGQPLERPTRLRDGQRIRLGDVVLTFEDPGTRRAEAFLEDVQRLCWPAPVVDLLGRLHDPRVALALIERLAPDPWAERAGHAALAASLGEQVATSAREAVRRAEANARASIPAQLALLSGAPEVADPEGWLTWWDGVRGRDPRYAVQVGPTGAAPALRLRVTDGAPPAELALGDHGVILLGRDPKCHLQLASPSVSRLHATLFRLHRRLWVRDEGAAAGTRLDGQRVALALLDPGSLLQLGPLQVALEAAPPSPARLPSGALVLDPAWFEALVTLRHPGACAGLVGLLRAARDPGGSTQAARAAFPQDAAKAQAFAQRLQAGYAERAAAARQLLPTLLGQDAGDDLAAWEGLLAARADALPLQVLPAGWLAATR